MSEAAVGAHEWAGKQLDDIAGVAVGKIDGVLVDSESRAVEWISVKLTRFGGRTLVPARDAVAAVDEVWTPFDASAINSAPKSKGDLTQAAEMELLRHYRIDGPAGRAAEIADRGPEETTARSS
jgi:PRC-barrel domain protein